MDENSLEVRTALQAVRMASDLCRRVRNDLGAEGSILKDDRSPVTVADFASQAILCKTIRESFPEDAIAAEENSKELREPDRSGILDRVTSYVARLAPGSSPKDVCTWIDYGTHSVAERYWAVDPIDGTKGFLRNDQYAIAIALVEKGTVKLGLLGCPNLYADPGHPDGERGCIFLGIRGKGSVQIDGAGVMRKVLAVSKVKNPREASFAESVESEHGDLRSHARLASAMGILAPPLKMDSQAKYGILARGEVTFYIRIPSSSAPGYKENVWDHAAGSIITEEAGGRVTDILERPLDFASGIRMEKNHGILASNGMLHDTVLRALAMQLMG